MVDKHVWVLKTRGGGLDKYDQWPDFLREGVIACGWDNLSDPSEFPNLDQYRKAMMHHLPNLGKSFNHATKTVHNFCHSIQAGDAVVISRGYNTDSQSIFLYGTTIAGRFRFDASSAWWKFKRHAAIERIEREISRLAFVAAFGVQTMMQTLHGPFPESAIQQVTQILHAPQPTHGQPTIQDLNQLKARKLLKKALLNYFSISDIKTLCFDSGIVNFDNLAGDTLLEKIQELILFCEKRNNLKQLWDEIDQARPGLIYSIQD